MSIEPLSAEHLIGLACDFAKAISKWRRAAGHPIGTASALERGYYHACAENPTGKASEPGGCPLCGKRPANMMVCHVCLPKTYNVIVSPSTKPSIDERFHKARLAACRQRIVRSFQSGIPDLEAMREAIQLGDRSILGFLEDLGLDPQFLMGDTDVP